MTLLDDLKINVECIALPKELHYDWVMKAFKADNLFCSNILLTSSASVGAQFILESALVRGGETSLQSGTFSSAIGRRLHSVQGSRWSARIIDPDGPNRSVRLF